MKLKFQEIRRTNDLFFTCSALVNAEKITTVKEFLVNYRVRHHRKLPEHQYGDSAGFP